MQESLNFSLQSGQEPFLDEARHRLLRKTKTKDLGGEWLMVWRGARQRHVRGHAEPAAASKVVAALLAVALGLARVFGHKAKQCVSVCVCGVGLRGCVPGQLLACHS